MTWTVLLTACSMFLPPGTYWDCTTIRERAFKTEQGCRVYVDKAFDHWNEKRECVADIR